MSKFNRFEDIIAWQKARVLVNDLYKIIDEVEKFKKDYNLKDQILRASFSIMLNIAEGFGRKSNKDFIHFLIIAHGSASEIQSALYIALDKKYINQTHFTSLYDEAGEISKMLMGLIKYLSKD
jgi:four helix bundle protein